MQGPGSMAPVAQRLTSGRRTKSRLHTPCTLVRLFPTALCDKNGCDLQSYRLGEKEFWGPGSGFALDSTQPVTVTTRFITDDGTDNGKLTEVERFYIQNGKTIEHPMCTVNGNLHNTISGDLCVFGLRVSGIIFQERWFTHVLDGQRGQLQDVRPQEPRVHVHGR